MKLLEMIIEKIKGIATEEQGEDEKAEDKVIIYGEDV